MDRSENACGRESLLRGNSSATMELMSWPSSPPLPPDLPEPADDGAADHLQGLRVEPVWLPATTGQEVAVGGTPGPTVLFCYPRMGRPDAALLVSEWDSIPGARGCTPEACGFRDVYAEFAAAGFEVFGLSTEDAQSQSDAVDRLGLPFPLLSDPRLRLAMAWRLPVFEVAGQALLKRLTLLVRDAVVVRVWYPVFPPDRHAAEVLDALRG